MAVAEAKGTVRTQRLCRPYPLLSQDDSHVRPLNNVSCSPERGRAGTQEHALTLPRCGVRPFSFLCLLLLSPPPAMTATALCRVPGTGCRRGHLGWSEGGIVVRVGEEGRIVDDPDTSAQGKSLIFPFVSSYSTAPSPRLIPLSTPCPFSSFLSHPLPTLTPYQDSQPLHPKDIVQLAILMRTPPILLFSVETHLPHRIISCKKITYTLLTLWHTPTRPPTHSCSRQIPSRTPSHRSRSRSSSQSLEEILLQVSTDDRDRPISPFNPAAPPSPDYPSYHICGTHQVSPSLVASNSTRSPSQGNGAVLQSYQTHIFALPVTEPQGKRTKLAREGFLSLPSASMPATPITVIKANVIVDPPTRFAPIPVPTRLYPLTNDKGQRICRQCGLPGRYKDGKVRASRARSLQHISDRDGEALVNSQGSAHSVHRNDTAFVYPSPSIVHLSVKPESSRSPEARGTALSSRARPSDLDVNAEGDVDADADALADDDGREHGMEVDGDGKVDEELELLEAVDAAEKASENSDEYVKCEGDA
ncbi:hypothetical protein EW146_g8895 [Bondarzewia mesenterica]|uniref:Uncharacterized protein n=1 Tax=Bondarzewia mesenterica TaxID=1095465 RepID=A0A4S4LB27_9AGAM|nr:hypothetical protein EW146_g8895 [Bondarzewia mesenterica]